MFCSYGRGFHLLCVIGGLGLTLGGLPWSLFTLRKLWNFFEVHRVCSTLLVAVRNQALERCTWSPKTKSEVFIAGVRFGGMLFLPLVPQQDRRLGQSVLLYWTIALVIGESAFLCIFFVPWCLSPTQTMPSQLVAQKQNHFPVARLAGRRIGCTFCIFLFFTFGTGAASCACVAVRASWYSC